MSELKLLDPRSMRKANEIEVDLGDGTMVVARRQDMTLLVFQGHVPMPMLAAVQRMIELPNATPAERVDSLGGEGRNLVDLLRRHAVTVVMKPRITDTDTGELDALPVEYLGIQQLMAIWNATAVVPIVGTSQAAEFRGGAESHDAPPVPDEPEVPPAPKQLVNGRDIEYVGR
jgi:hypothetical protein